MKKTLCLVSAAMTLSAAAWMAGADRKEPGSIDVPALVKETQNSTTKGSLRVVWWVPQEFWQASLKPSKDVTTRQVQDVLTALDKYTILAVIRGDISSSGAFVFHDRQTIQESLQVSYTGAGGKTTAMSPVSKLDEAAQKVLDTVTPMLKASLGRVGENLHFFVYDDRGADGRRLVWPYEKGKLTVVLAKLSQDAGSTVEFDCPLDALFVPRICAACAQPAHVRWSFCPWCGRQLPTSQPASAPGT